MTHSHYERTDENGDFWFVMDRRDLTWIEHNVWARLAHWCDRLTLFGLMDYFSEKAFSRAWTELNWPEPWRD